MHRTVRERGVVRDRELAEGRERLRVYGVSVWGTVQVALGTGFARAVRGSYIHLMVVVIA